MKFSFVILLGLCPFLTYGNNPFADKDKLKEGPCMDWKQSPDIDNTWLEEVKMKGLYYQMGSKHWFYTITESLTGKPPTENSPKESCLSNVAGKDAFMLRGYGNKADYKCPKTPDGKQDCFPTYESTNYFWATKRGTTEATFVWASSDKKWLLGFRCNGLQRIWSLRSTEKIPLDPATKKAVLDYIKTHGFNPDNAVPLSQDECPDVQPYPA